MRANFETALIICFIFHSCFCFLATIFAFFRSVLAFAFELWCIISDQSSNAIWTAFLLLIMVFNPGPPFLFLQPLYSTILMYLILAAVRMTAMKLG
jgi:hypothetical protein